MLLSVLVIGQSCLVTCLSWKQEGSLSRAPQGVEETEKREMLKKRWKEKHLCKTGVGFVSKPRIIGLSSRY